MLIPNVFTAAAILSALVAGIPIPANHELSQQTLSKGIDPKKNLDLSKRARPGPTTAAKKLIVYISPYGPDKKHPDEVYADMMRERMRQKDMEREALEREALESQKFKIPDPSSRAAAFGPPPRKN
ncbi:hypothetical protein HYALB_00012867 [Hymenoscyphus albidus]|uniref:Uncharacterized protein n=1 Tax=Hymenoscyphus albidus TaxID=595503 RepID=A0A9N9LYJ5_9HELO|nr:hypothetical protein HYALB_00012867 [Hymenoscyphus albidus]